MNEKKPFWKQERNLWILFGVAVILVGIFFLRPLWGTLGGTSGSTLPSTTKFSPQPGEPLTEEEIASASLTFQLLNQVKGGVMASDFAIFGDARFKKLEPFEVQITVPQLGRPTPFSKF